MKPQPALVAALTREILPKGLGVAARDPACMPADIDPAEASTLCGAVPQRITEFHAGRAAAREAMTQLGMPVHSVMVAPDRAPIWPEGLTGSISHSRTACVAAVGSAVEWAGLGVDLEEDTALDPLDMDLVCTRAERHWLGKQPTHERGLMAKLIFSAKEAAYKAQYPVTGLLFGFDVLAVSVDREKSRFEARFEMAQGPFRAGEILRGGYAHAAGLLVTGVVIRHSAVAQMNDR